MSNVFVISYDEPEYDKGEILRYAGIKKNSSEMEALVDASVSELKEKLSYKVCFCEFPIVFSDAHIDLGFAKTESEKLRINLKGCNKTIVFAATLGIELDRMIARYSYMSPARALMLQAIGAERIEALCNKFCADLAEEKALVGEKLRPRFSPGYGDLPLDFQRPLITVLDAPKRIGVVLNESLLMSPSKSVTAIIGLKKKN